MSKYTTGEIAKLCGVTVRTVQYYDNRGILIPSELSEGGRRLYCEDDLKRMKIICFLRDLGLSLDTIAKLMEEEHPENVIDLILQQQEQLLRSEIGQRQEKLSRVEQMQRELKNVEHFCVESIGDIAYMMENRKKLRTVRGIMLGVGIPLEVIEWGTFTYGILSGIWWPFVLGLCVLITGSIWMVWFYYRNVKYICPQCHTIFRPRMWDMFWAPHTPTARQLKCTDCGHKGFCVEVYGGDET